MAFMKKDMEQVLQKYAGFGYTIYYLYQQGKVQIEEIQEVFRKLNPDIASLYLDKLLRKMDLKDMEKAFLEYQQEYSKEMCLKDYFAIDGGKITLKNDIYETALNYRYTEKMLGVLENQSKDPAEGKIVTSYQFLLRQMTEETKQSVMQTSQNVVVKAR